MSPFYPTGPHMLQACDACDVVLGRHFGQPYSCNGFREKRRRLRAPLPLRLACAAALDGLNLAHSITTSILKKGTR